MILIEVWLCLVDFDKAFADGQASLCSLARQIYLLMLILIKVGVHCQMSLH